MSEKKDHIRPTLHDIVNGLTVAHAFAEVYGEHYPEHVNTVQKFIKQIGRAKRELVVAIHPGVKESKKKRKGNRD